VLRGGATSSSNRYPPAPTSLGGTDTARYRPSQGHEKSVLAMTEPVMGSPVMKLTMITADGAA